MKALKRPKRESVISPHHAPELPASPLPPAGPPPPASEVPSEPRRSLQPWLCWLIGPPPPSVSSPQVPSLHWDSQPLAMLWVQQKKTLERLPSPGMGHIQSRRKAGGEFVRQHRESPQLMTSQKRCGWTLSHSFRNTAWETHTQALSWVRSTQNRTNLCCTPQGLASTGFQACWCKDKEQCYCSLEEREPWKRTVLIHFLLL